MADEGELEAVPGRVGFLRAGRVVGVAVALGVDVGPAGEDEPVEKVEPQVMEVVRAHFRPEFLNRIDEIIVFHPLSREQLTRIVDVQLGHLRKRLAARNLKLSVSDAAKKQLAEEGYDPQYGARPLKRVIQQRIENTLAGRILAGEFADGNTVVVDADGGKGGFTFGKGAERVEGELVEEEEEAGAR